MSAVSMVPNRQKLIGSGSYSTLYRFNDGIDTLLVNGIS
jgi:hypothetical protein